MSKTPKEADDLLAEYARNRKPMSTAELVQDILATLPIKEKRIFFDDKNQTICEQALVGDTWVNMREAEHVPYKKEYFTRRLQGK